MYRRTFGQDINNNEEVTQSCEFCNKPYRISVFDLHSAYCSKRPRKINKFNDIAHFTRGTPSNEFQASKKQRLKKVSAYDPEHRQSRFPSLTTMFEEYSSDRNPTQISSVNNCVINNLTYAVLDETKVDTEIEIPVDTGSEYKFDEIDIETSLQFSSRVNADDVKTTVIYLKIRPEYQLAVENIISFEPQGIIDIEENDIHCNLNSNDHIAYLNTENISSDDTMNDKSIIEPVSEITVHQERTEIKLLETPPSIKEISPRKRVHVEAENQSQLENPLPLSLSEQKLKENRFKVLQTMLGQNIKVTKETSEEWIVNGYIKIPLSTLDYKVSFFMNCPSPFISSVPMSATLSVQSIDSRFKKADSLISSPEKLNKDVRVKVHYSEKLSSKSSHSDEYNNNNLSDPYRKSATGTHNKNNSSILSSQCGQPSFKTNQEATTYVTKRLMDNNNERKIKQFDHFLGPAAPKKPLTPTAFTGRNILQSLRQSQPVSTSSRESIFGSAVGSLMLPTGGGAQPVSGVKSLGGARGHSVNRPQVKVAASRNIGSRASEILSR